MTELHQQFRDAMARVPAPVTVITTMDDEGNPQGTTVSAFASLSITPPMVIFALDNRGVMKDRIAASGRCGVNILSGDQAHTASVFARPGDRFSGVDWKLTDGVPELDGVASFLCCDKLQFLPGGDHIIVLAEVASAHSYGDQSLSYHLRAFHGVPHS